MTAHDERQRRIGLLGATGYTGRLTAAELHRRGIRPLLAGRSRDRLRAVERFGDTTRVDTADPRALAAFLDGLDAVISCVGPFTELGRPVLAAAAAAGVPYVDSAGEPDFLAHVYDAYPNVATPIVPACGFDYVPGDLAAAIAADALGAAPERILVGYRSQHTAVSRGTARSALAAFGTASIRPRRVLLPYPGGDVGALVLPWGEELTVRRRFPQAQVDTAFVTHGTLSYAGPVLRRAIPIARAASPLLARLVERLPEGPADKRRADSRSDVLAVATSGARRARVLVRTRDAYALTAVLLVEAALRLPDAPAGARSPAEAFDAQAFLDAVRGPLLGWEMLQS